ncbi:hypothetical protein EMIT0P100_10692 [Pseudomonas sp. IT-P100]
MPIETLNSQCFCISLDKDVLYETLESTLSGSQVCLSLRSNAALLYSQPIQSSSHRPTCIVWRR